MRNRIGSRTGAAWLAAAGAGMLLSGCVAVVVPVAAGGLIGRSAISRHGRGETPPDTPAAPASVSATPPARTVPAKSVETSRPAPAKAAALPAPVIPVSPADAPTATVTTSWYDVVRVLAKMGLQTPDPQKTSVLGPAGKPVRCGARPTAVAIDAATLGADDYIYAGSLHSMGFEIVLTATAAALSPEQVRGLAKQGIAAPKAGRTLFVAPPGGEDAARAAIARQYCVVGLVGARAADFPGSVLPGSPGADPGWFLVAAH